MNVISLLAGLVISIIFAAMVFNARKNKSKYGFEVIPMWLELFKIAIVIVAINLLTFSLAAYNGIPVVLILLIGMITLYTFITQRTIFGRHVYALGGNEKAAKLSGVKTKRFMFLVYTNMGLLSALAGLVLLGAVFFDVLAKKKSQSG